MHKLRGEASMMRKLALWVTLGCTLLPAFAVVAQGQSLRFLDRAAIEDAHRNAAQAPNPHDVLAANSVVRLPAAGPVRAVFLGDSILTGWSGYFARTFPDALLDGRVGRQFSAAIPIWRALAQEHLVDQADVVVVELGTNGPVSPADLRTFLNLVGQRQVFLVMPHVPRPWESQVHALYRQAADADPNVHLVPWDAVSRGHPDYFWADQVHPNWRGVQALVGAIAEALRQQN